MFTGDCKTMEQKRGYPNLDAAKFLCALLIVIIHTSPLQNVSAVAHFYVNDVITRVAVPLFFAMSGFLFFRKLDFAEGKIARTKRNFACILKATRKNMLLYIAWSLIYLVIVLPEWYRTGWWGLPAIKDWLYSLLFSGAYYHLWYLLALVVSLPVLYVLLMYIPLKRFWVVGSVLWILECVTYSYSWIGVDQIPLIMAISNRMPVVFDALFRAVPLLFIGAACTQIHPKHTSVWLCVGALLLCAAEASLLYFFSPNEGKFSYLFATPLMTCTILTVLVYGRQITLPPLWQSRLRDMSLLIYCLHPMICYFFREWGFPSGIPFWLAVTVTVVAVSGIRAFLKEKPFARCSLTNQF